MGNSISDELLGKSRWWRYHTSGGGGSVIADAKVPAGKRVVIEHFTLSWDDASSSDGQILLRTNDDAPVFFQVPIDISANPAGTVTCDCDIILPAGEGFEVTVVTVTLGTVTLTASGRFIESNYNPFDSDDGADP